MAGKIRTTNERKAAPTEIARRQTKLLPGGVYTFRDELRIEGELSTTVLTGSAWLLEHFEVASGRILFLTGTTQVEPSTNNFWIFYPPFTITRPCLVALCGKVSGTAGTAAVPEKFKAAPIVFEAGFPGPEVSLAQILARASNILPVDAHPHASSLSMKARKWVAESYVSNPSIARIAAILGVSNAHLSRQFRRDYAMSPREYLHRVRIADVPIQLARGESISDVSSRAGYGDLSRFYKHFSKATDVSPGRCRRGLAPQKSGFSN